MTIKISRDQKMFGVDAVALREALRRVGNSAITPLWFSERLGIGNCESDRLARDLVAANWMQPWDGDPLKIELTELGRSFARARATRSLKRTTADRLLAGAIKAAKAINCDGAMTHYVEELYVFGSYLTNKPEIGDLDLGVKLRRRMGRMNVDAWMNWCRDLGYARGAGSILEIYGYSEQLVLRRIKQRSSYVSVHPVDDLDRVAAERKLVFKCGARIAAPRQLRSA